MLPSSDPGRFFIDVPQINLNDRGEILLKQENPLPWAQVLHLTDEEFVAKTGTTLEVIILFCSEEINSFAIGIE